MINRSWYLVLLSLFNKKDDMVQILSSYVCPICWAGGFQQERLKSGK
jgi:hypothetical protein